MHQENEPIKPISFSLEGEKIIFIQNVEGNITVGENEAFSLAVDFLDILSLKDPQDRHRLLLTYLARYKSDSSTLPLEMKEKATSLYLQLAKSNQDQIEQLFDFRQTKKSTALVQRLGWFMAGSLSSYGVTVLFDDYPYDDDNNNDNSDDDDSSDNNSIANVSSTPSNINLDISFEKRYEVAHQGLQPDTITTTNNALDSSSNNYSGHGKVHQSLNNESVKPPIRHELNFDISSSNGESFSSTLSNLKVLDDAKPALKAATKVGNLANLSAYVPITETDVNTVIEAISQAADHSNTVNETVNNLNGIGDALSWLWQAAQWTIGIFFALGILLNYLLASGLLSWALGIMAIIFLVFVGSSLLGGNRRK